MEDTILTSTLTV